MSQSHIRKSAPPAPKPIAWWQFALPFTVILLLLVAAYLAVNWIRSSSPNYETVNANILEIRKAVDSTIDSCWKGKRIDELETKTVEILSSASGRPAWDCYAALDDILELLAGGADAHLEWQRQFGTQRIVSSG